MFKIDVARQVLDVEQAKSDLAKAKAGLAEAEAALAQSHANSIKSQANIRLAEKNAQRYASLMNGAISKQEQDQMFAVRDGRVPNMNRCRLLFSRRRLLSVSKSID